MKYTPSMKHLPKALCLAAVAVPLLAASPADAKPKRAVFIGSSVRFNALGSYDLGKGLGNGAGENDLGPGTLGFELFAGVVPAPRLRLAGEFGIAIGGLTGTDERYFGSRSETGSTSTASAKASASYELGKVASLPYSLGLALGAERLSEATGLGYVRLSAMTAGAFLDVATKSGWSLQVRGELHKPYSASIEGQVSGASPSGHFTSFGAAISYRFDMFTL